MATRADVVAFARECIGTPFQHRGRKPGVGLDCGGFVICAARKFGSVAPEFDVDPYTVSVDKTFRKLCDKHLIPISHTVMQAGDIVVLIVEEEPQHMGILGVHPIYGGHSIIHASNSKSTRPPRVIETRLLYSRVQLFVAAYALPNIS